MSANCPYCGSSNTEKTFNFNESSCQMCGCDFKVFEGNRIRVFTEGNWKKFCESVSVGVNKNITAANVNHFIHGVLNEFSKTPEEVDVLIEHLTDYADGLYRDFQAGLRSKNDFFAVLEGIETVEKAATTLKERTDLDLDIRYEAAEDWDIPELPGEMEEPYEDEVSDEEVPQMMGLAPEEIEEEELDVAHMGIERSIDDVDDEISDVERALGDMRTPEDKAMVNDEIDDVEAAIDQLWAAYQAEGGEEDIGGEDDFNLGMSGEEGEEDFGLDDMDNMDDMDDLGDEGSDELGDEEGKDGMSPEEAAAEEEPVLQESSDKATTPTNTKFRKTREGNTIASYKSKDEHQIGSIEDGSDAVEDEEEIPYTEEEDADGKNLFGDNKLSTSRGAVDSRPKGEDFVKQGKPDGTGLGIREGFNGYRVGDKVYISESRDEWEIVSLEKNKAEVKRGRTVTTVDLFDEEVGHADKGLRHMRQRDVMSEAKSAWERTQQTLNESGCIGGVCGLSGNGDGSSLGGTLVSPLSPVSIGGNSVIGGEKSANVKDRSEIYRFIKDNDLHRAPREQAYTAVIQEFNNPEEELNNVLDDAILSNDESQVEQIDTLYNYKTSDMRAFEEAAKLKKAFAIYEKREDKERAKLLKESVDAPKPTRREEQNNPEVIENLGRSWINRVANDLEQL